MHRRSVLATVLGLTSTLGMAGCSSLGGNEAGSDSTDEPNLTSPSDSETSPSEGSSSSAKSTPDPNQDVDGDGFLVCEEQQLLEDAVVGRADIYVEVDWTDGNRPDSDQMERLKAVYDTAPVDASNGADSGMNLHIVYGKKVPGSAEPFGLDELVDYKREYFDNEGRGYHYALCVDEVKPPAFGREDNGHILIQSQQLESRGFTQIEIFAHELGHALGLSRDVFDGVDNGREYTFDEYPSVMNYHGNGDDEYLDFSDGTHSERDFDDWSYLQDNLLITNNPELAESDLC